MNAPKTETLELTLPEEFAEAERRYTARLAPGWTREEFIEEALRKAMEAGLGLDGEAPQADE